MLNETAKIVTLLHNNVNPSKHQYRPNVGAVPGQRRIRWTNTETTRISSLQTRDTHQMPDQRWPTVHYAGPTVDLQSKFIYDSVDMPTNIMFDIINI